jgi:manganese transport protein
MEGYLRLRINPWVRRLMTRLIAIIPAVIVILVNGEKNIDSLLVLSQVILSLQLGFAIIPLIHFTSDKKTMGKFAIKTHVIILASIITAVLVYLNIRMVVEQASSFFASSDSIIWKAIILLSGIFYLTLLLTAIIYPLRRKKEKVIPRLHADAVKLGEIQIPAYNKIAVALDFSESDRKLITHAIGQGGKNTSFVLIHVVESASAKMLEQESDDLETRKDFEQLNNYVQQLALLGFTSTAKLGFGNRVKEIVRLVKENNAEMLVIGAHGHSGMKDLLYGQTTDNVRHELKIPVLVVNV